MICTTVRKDTECFFMKKSGCTFNGGSCSPIIEKCEGCNKIIEFSSKKYCSTVPAPESKWRNGICNLASHVKVEKVKKVQKLNPIKASKRGR